MISTLAARSGRASSILLFSILLLLVSAVAWASLARLDEVTRGTGRVIPSLQLQVVQSLEGGIVRKLYVQEGDHVDAGAPLLELDPTLHRSQYEQVLQQYYAQVAQAHRLEAETSGGKLAMPRELMEKVAVQVAAETSLYIGRQNELRSQLGALREQLVQKQQELVAADAALAGGTRALELARQSRDVIRRLVSKGLEAELTLIGEETKVSDLENRMVIAHSEIARLRAGIQEIREKVEATMTGFRGTALAELSATRARTAELGAQLEGLRDRVERATLVAPVSGIVNRVHIRTIGAVAQPAETLVEIVPAEDSLIVEAYVKPADIAFIHAGQDARVKLTAYDASRYGGLDGHIVKISADAVPNPDAQGRPAAPAMDPDVYVVTVKTGASQLRKDGKVLTILPGMKAEVDIITGKRTVLDYLVHPVVRISDRAFREAPR